MPMRPTNSSARYWKNERQPPAPFGFFGRTPRETTRTRTSVLRFVQYIRESPADTDHRSHCEFHGFGLCSVQWATYHGRDSGAS